MKRPKVLFLQPGDYAEAYRRLAAGEPETYWNQRRSVSHVAELAGRFEVSVLSMSEPSPAVTLAPGLSAAGVAKETVFAPVIAERLDAEAPDLFVCRTPSAPALGWAAARDVPTLPCFADLFARGGPRQWWRNRRLARILASGIFPCIANHSLNASLSMEHVLRLAPERIVPWDWGRLEPDPEPKHAPTGEPPVLFYAGALVAAKGVEDVIEAVAVLRGRGRRIRLKIAGVGSGAEAVASRVRALGLEEHVALLGLLSNDEVRAQMRAADVVVVPSRHTYPEGLPNTIYEALASRTPLVISDHPAFVTRFRSGVDCLVFAAGKAGDLARVLDRLMEDTALYAQLSKSAPQALASLYVGMEWWSLLDGFMRDPSDATGWVARHSLNALGERTL